MRRVNSEAGGVEQTWIAAGKQCEACPYALSISARAYTASKTTIVPEDEYYKRVQTDTHNHEPINMK